jgi:hypothetical protein
MNAAQIGGSGGNNDVARRSILVALAVAVVAAWSGNASAATTPSAPQLASAPYASPAVLQWTPAASDPSNPNVSQTVYRAPGACTNPLTPGVAIRVYQDNTTSQHVEKPGDGTFCFSITATDFIGGTADGPGLTVTIDTTPPTATVAVSNIAAGGIVKGTVDVARTSADATSGVAASVLHLGAVGSCAAGPVLRPHWNTTRVPDGAYDVCNVVTDRAGLTATATLTVTVANAVPAPAPAPTPAVPAAPVSAPPVVVAVAAPVNADKRAPGSPTKLAVIRGRAKSGGALIPLTLRWANPVASDLDRVVVVLNATHPPRSVKDGTVVYRGLRTSATIKLRPGKIGRVALYAYDHSGNVSRPARKTVSLASLIPLRPLTGSVVTAAPRLTWTPTQGTEYYNVQIFRNGKRILTDWPSRASYRLPGRLLEPGTYTWFVWPALKGTGSAASFGALIGRATFVYNG